MWCGSRICQKRASNGSTVVRNYFEQGFEEGTTDYFNTKDHLGSVREVIGSDGTTVASRVSYDPWGKTTETGSGALTDFGYTGHYVDRPTGLALTWFRGYDPNLGRWLSKDPIGLRGGLNVYEYVKNDPIDLTDPDGLFPWFPPGPHPFSPPPDICDPKNKDDCKKKCEKDYESDSAYCRSIPGDDKEARRRRQICWEEAMNRYSRCLADCDKNHK